MQSHKPVSYASVWKENKIYTTADSLGYFYINKESNQNYKITAIGFNDKYITDFSNVINDILLESKTILLEDVKIVNPSFQHIEKFGKAKKGTFVGVNFDVTTSEFVKFFPYPYIKNKTEFIKSVSFYTNTTSNKRKVNIVIYNVDSDGNPGQVINNENIICNLKKGKTLNEIDLSKLKIIVPQEGFFVGIQHLIIEDNKYYPAVNNPTGKSFCYEPFFSVTENPKVFDSWDFTNGVWKKNNLFSLNIEVQISD